MDQDKPGNNSHLPVDKIRRKRRIWSHLLKKSSMENFILCAVVSLLINSINAGVLAGGFLGGTKMPCLSYLQF